MLHTGLTMRVEPRPALGRRLQADVMHHTAPRYWVPSSLRGRPVPSSLRLRNSSDRHRLRITLTILRPPIAFRREPGRVRFLVHAKYSLLRVPVQVRIMVNEPVNPPCCRMSQATLFHHVPYKGHIETGSDTCIGLQKSHSSAKISGWGRRTGCRCQNQLELRPPTLSRHSRRLAFGRSEGYRCCCCLQHNRHYNLASPGLHPRFQLCA